MRFSKRKYIKYPQRPHKEEEVIPMATTKKLFSLAAIFSALVMV
jgi:hypothetical protein